jgi:hypothetical protein
MVGGVGNDHFRGVVLGTGRAADPAGTIEGLDAERHNHGKQDRADRRHEQRYGQHATTA